MTAPTWIIVKRHHATGRLVAGVEPYEHASLEDAKREARRLSRLQEDTDFLIFEAIGKAVYQPVQLTMIDRRDLDERIPF